MFLNKQEYAGIVEALAIILCFFFPIFLGVWLVMQ
jgi:hypothetical protein